MGSKNNPGAFDCYERAEPDEPRFTLLGRDRHAPVLVWLWGALRGASGEAQDVVTEAIACARQMVDYARGKGRPVLDIPTERLLKAARVLLGQQEPVHELHGIDRLTIDKTLSADVTFLLPITFTVAGGQILKAELQPGARFKLSIEADGTATMTKTQVDDG